MKRKLPPHILLIVLVLYSAFNTFRFAEQGGWRFYFALIGGLIFLGIFITVSFQKVNKSES